MSRVLEERVCTAQLMVRFGQPDTKGKVPEAERTPTVIDIPISGASLKRAFGNADISACTGTELSLVSYDVTGCNSPVCLICPEESLPGHNVIVDATAPSLSCFAILYHGKPCEQMRGPPENLSASIISKMAEDGRGMMVQTIRDCAIEDKKVYVPKDSPILGHLEHPALPEDEDVDDSENEKTDQVVISIEEWEAAILGYLSQGRVVDLTRGFNLKALLLYGLPMTHQGVLEISLRTITGVKGQTSVDTETVVEKSREVITPPSHESSDSAVPVSPSTSWTNLVHLPEGTYPGNATSGHSSSSSSVVPEYAIRATSDSESNVAAPGTSHGRMHGLAHSSARTGHGDTGNDVGAVPVQPVLRHTDQHTADDHVDGESSDDFQDVKPATVIIKDGKQEADPVPAGVQVVGPASASAHKLGPSEESPLLHSSPLLSRWDHNPGHTSGSDENHLPVAPSDPSTSVENSPSPVAGALRGRDAQGNIVSVKPLPFDEM